jgi:hypothetical protein
VVHGTGAAEGRRGDFRESKVFDFAFSILFISKARNPKLEMESENQNSRRGTDEMK